MTLAVVVDVVVVALVVVIVTSASALGGSQSSTDTRAYLPLKLDSGLDVLIISDANTTSTAIALDVHSGSFDEDISGLAHLLEHVHFTDDFDALLSTRGGATNAFTMASHTNYFASSRQSAAELVGAFLRLFTAPALTTSSIQAQVVAVNSEHTKNRANDAWRRLRAMQLSAVPVTGVFSHFSTGSTTTLANVTVADLRRFVHRHYVAPRMRLVVASSESLETMKAAVQEHAETLGVWQDESSSSSSAKSELSSSSSSSLPSPSPPSYPTPVLSPIAYASTTSTTLTFVTPHTGAHLSSIVVRDFITSQLGSEHTASLAASLRRRGLVSNFETGIDFAVDEYALLTSTLELTDDGLDVVGDIVDAYRRFAGVLANATDASTLEALWAMYRSASDVNFELGPPKVTSAGEASSIAMRMQYLDSSSPTLLRFDVGASSTESIDVQQVRAIFADVASTKTSVMLATSVPRTAEEPAWAAFDDVYAFGYEPLDESTLARGTAIIDDAWSVETPLASYPTIDGLRTLAAAARAAGDSTTASSSTTLVAVDTHFGSPKAHVRLALESPALLASPALRTSYILGIDVLVACALPRHYVRRRLGYSYALVPTSTGLNLVVDGYADGAVDLAKQLLQLVLKPDECFANTTDAVFSSLVSSRRVEQAASTRTLAVSRAFSARWRRERSPPAIDARLLPYKATTLAQARVALDLAHNSGECRHSAVVAGFVSDDVAQDLLSVSPCRPGLVRTSIAVLPSSAATPEPLTLAGVEHEPNNAAVVVQQLADVDVEKPALLSIHCDFISAAIQTYAFAKLRTNETLGYIAGGGCSGRDLYVYVQSAHVNSSALGERLMRMLSSSELHDVLVSTALPALESLRASLLASIEEADHTLAGRAERLYGSVRADHMAMALNRTDQQARVRSQIKCVSPSSLRRFIDDALGGDATMERRRLLLLVKNETVADETPASLIERLRSGADEDARIVDALPTYAHAGIPEYCTDASSSPSSSPPSSTADDADEPSSLHNASGHTLAVATAMVLTLAVLVGLWTMRKRKQAQAARYAELKSLED